jgi:4'-phosphopantetheinyl transferase
LLRFVELMNTANFFAPPTKAHVWSMSTTAHDSARRVQDILSPDELDTASRFHFERDRTRYVASHVQLRQILSRYLSLPPEEIKFGHGSHGKPFIELARRSVAFNLSHSGDLALVAVTNESEVGVDIEQVRGDSSFAQIAKQSFSTGENQWLESLDSDDELRGFFRLWTLKEACMKAAGGGLSIPLNLFEINFDGGYPEVSSSDEALAGPWDIRELNVAEDYAAAIAVRGTISELTLF